MISRTWRQWQCWGRGPPAQDRRVDEREQVAQLDPVRFGLVLGLESLVLAFLSVSPSSGALIVGAVLTLVLVVGDLFVRRSPRA